MLELDIVELSDYSHARKRNEMYFGSRDPHTQVVLEYNDRPIARETTWTPAIFTAFREIIDNALDELVGFHQGDQIDITFDAVNFIFTVQDNGRGIPLDKATLAMSKPRAGRNFGERGSLRGLNGIGASVVNFCSSWFTMDIWRDGKHFAQRFTEGDDRLWVLDPTIKRVRTKQRGTRIEFRLSPSVFKTMILPESFMQARAYETALCYPDLKVTYNGKRVMAALDTVLHNSVEIAIAAGNFSSRFWLMPGFLAEGEHIHSLVNGIPCFDGGVHIDTFRKHFYPGLLAALERESKRRKLTPNRADICDGLLTYNITMIEAPNFNSQAKTRLSNEESGEIIRQALTEDFFKALIKRSATWIEQIYARCAERTLKKDASETNRLAKKNARNKVPDLQDACAVNRQKCILFLGEGKSAISGMVDARDPDLHGGMPLRGKVMNVDSKPIKDVLENEALASVMAAIGLIPGQRANRHSLRYGKVYIATDADEDGKNIACLLINFFYKFWPELFDPTHAAFIYIFDTPLIIAVKGKVRRYWYSTNVDTFEPDKFRGWDITRAKGLAALKRHDWKHALTEQRVHPIVDDGGLKDALTLIFGQGNGATDRRKVWIGL